MMAEEDTQWSFIELYNLPLVLRRFFVTQMEERGEKKQEAFKKGKNNNTLRRLGLK